MGLREEIQKRIAEQLLDGFATQIDPETQRD